MTCISRLMTTLFILAKIFNLSEQTELQISYEASTNTYNPVPEEFELINVAVLTRHGDRAQITRSLGPLHSEDDKITSFWRTRLPIEKTFRIMGVAAAPVLDELMNQTALMSNIYSGYDQSHSPYAQLTELGALQLLAVGHELRRRYVGSFLPSKVEDAADLMYCRSTNICRTVQSLRSLLAGMYNKTADSFQSSTDTKIKSNPLETKTNRKLGKLNKLPYISTRQKSRETLFPHAGDGPCSHMTERRVKLYHHHLNSTAIQRWGTLEKRMINLIGSTHKRIGWLTWLNILDVFTAFQAHNVTFPSGITKQDLEQITELVGWTWEVLYADNMLSRLAIGRFIGEMIKDMDKAVSFTVQENHRSNLNPNPKPKLNPNPKPDVTSSISNDTVYESTRWSDSASYLSGVKRKLMNGKNHNNTDDDMKNTDSSFKNVTAGTKILIYSGHDSTMVPLLGALGLYHGDWPPYASYLTLEVGRLIKIPDPSPKKTIPKSPNPNLDKTIMDIPPMSSRNIGDLYVRAVYNDRDMVMAGCDGFLWCPYELFRKQLLKTSLSSVEYQKQCRKKL